MKFVFNASDSDKMVKEYKRIIKCLRDTVHPAHLVQMDDVKRDFKDLKDIIGIIKHMNGKKIEEVGIRMCFIMSMKQKFTDTNKRLHDNILSLANATETHVELQLDTIRERTLQRGQRFSRNKDSTKKKNKLKKKMEQERRKAELNQASAGGVEKAGEEKENKDNESEDESGPSNRQVEIKV